MDTPLMIQNKIIDHHNYVNDIFHLDDEDNGLFKYKCENCGKDSYIALDKKYGNPGKGCIYSGRSLHSRRDYHKSKLATYLKSNQFSINANDIGNIVFHLYPNTIRLNFMVDNMVICNDCVQEVNQLTEFNAIIDPKFYSSSFDDNCKIYRFKAHLLHDETIEDIARKYKLIIVE